MKVKQANTASHHQQRVYQAFQAEANRARHQFSTKHPQAEEFFKAHNVPLQTIRKHAMNILASGAISASLFLTSPALAQVQPHLNRTTRLLTTDERQREFVSALNTLLPTSLTQPDQSTELEFSKQIWQYWGLDARPTLEGQRLNHVYGLMGAEQHLPRFPGDTVDQHDAIQTSGITPATGAWSYFTPSKEQLTDDLIQKEKYYVAVQTLYLPEWNTNTTFLKNWYKYRKVVVVNPVNGKVIIADIADSGPAKFTGKHFGGSPEVMQYLELDRGMKKGPVLLYFLAEDGQTIPLGPWEENRQEGKPYPH